MSCNWLNICSISAKTTSVRGLHKVGSKYGRYKKLGDLYPLGGDDVQAQLRQQGAILIDAHLAANAAGATACPRPEDTDIDPINGDLLIAFTAAALSMPTSSA